MISQDLLHCCNLCPHKCGVNRFEETGYCNVMAEPFVSSVFQHLGEEPVLSGELGVCNVFFAHCNLQCIYCQNHQISGNVNSNPSWIKSVDGIVNAIIPMLDNGIRILGFVSPTHQVVQMVEIIDCLHSKGYFPTIVYNSNCYENVETLKELEDVVDVYLPDFKYVNNDLGFQYSSVANYFDIAKLAIKEMFRQKGTSLLLGNDGIAEFGLIIRHLVLPGYAKESVELLRFLADEFSPRLHISLMSQYYPPSSLSLPYPINRVVDKFEYESVLNIMEEIGFRGWAQSLDSNVCYQPNFNLSDPFSS